MKYTKRADADIKTVVINTNHQTKKVFIKKPRGVNYSAGLLGLGYLLIREDRTLLDVRGKITDINLLELKLMLINDVFNKRICNTIRAI